MSNVRIHVPDGLHSWGLEFNYELSDSSAPALHFVRAVRTLPRCLPHDPRSWFHQCGSDCRDKGYQFLGYFGEEPEEAVLWAAEQVAAHLGCGVEI